jgi:hypothetical protein
VDYHDHPFWTEQFDNDAELRESNALVFDGAWMEEHFGPNGPDDDDIAAMNNAMDKDMRERDRCWMDRARGLESEVAELRARLAE